MKTVEKVGIMQTFIIEEPYNNDKYMITGGLRAVSRFLLNKEKYYKTRSGYSLVIHEMNLLEIAKPKFIKVTNKRFRDEIEKYGFDLTEKEKEKLLKMLK